jgi:hypothetical protein
VAWHTNYQDPDSSLARRLRVVQRDLRHALAESPGNGELRLASMCAGEGRDVLPVLAAYRGPREVTALLVELDPTLAGRARQAAADLGLTGVETITGDAGVTDPYLRLAPVHTLLACGVFGNVTLDDLRRTIATLPSLLAPGGIVIWTRGRGDSDADPALAVRDCFAAHGFTELSFTVPDDDTYRVGMHRLDAPTAEPHPGTRMFNFV